MNVANSKNNSPVITIVKSSDKTSWLDEIEIDNDYFPSEKEEYMNDKQLKYFSKKLLKWRETLIIESGHTLESLKNRHLQEPDESDRASSETETNLELRTRERYFKLITKIDIAMLKIENRTYGYCEETHEEIGLKRLEARPIATMSVAAQEWHEKKERLMHEVETEE